MIRQRISLVACFIAVILVGVPNAGWSGSQKAAVSAAAPGISIASFDSPVTAIVELESDPVVMQARTVDRGLGRGRKMSFDSPESLAYESRLTEEQIDFESRALLLAPKLQTVTHFRKLANAVSVSAPMNELARLAVMPGVRRIEYTTEYRATLTGSVPLIGAPAAWERLGSLQIAGEGVKIAIVDSGLDISNPLFSDQGFVAPSGFPRGSALDTNNKVIVAKAFLPDGSDSPTDQNGHGSNVAGIAAGHLGTTSPLGEISGVAPGAFLGNYRVLDRTGTGRSDLIARAVEEAASDGFDVANLSLGAPSRGPGFLEETIENAVLAGMVVVVSAGNEGENGATTIGSPGIARSAITVGASTNSHFVEPAVEVTSTESTAGLDAKLQARKGGGTVPSFDYPTDQLSIIDVRSLDQGNRACGALPAGSLTGKIALIERGGPNSCTFIQKVDAASAAGAVAVIVYNKDVSESDNGDGGESLINMLVDGTTIPSVFIRRSSGLGLRDMVAANPALRARVSPASGLASKADVLATFSSRGPSVNELLKPDVVAPGTSIYSAALPINNPDGVTDSSRFNPVEGTSQSAPHVTGAAALLKQLHPDWAPEQIKSVLVSTANLSVFSDVNPTSNATLLDIGGGRIDLSQAINAEATFSPASVSFGINKLKKKDVALSAELKIKNVSGGTGTFTVEVQQLDPGEGVTVSVSTGSLTIDDGQTGTFTLNIAALRAAQKRDYTGLVMVTGPAGHIQHVPYWVKFVKRKV